MKSKNKQTALFIHKKIKDFLCPKKLCFLRKETWERKTEKNTALFKLFRKDIGERREDTWERKLETKKAMFFSTDAIIALMIIFLTVMLVYPLIQESESHSRLETDVLEVLSSLKMSEINNSYVISLIDDGKIGNLDNSVLEQIGEFYVSNITLAREFSAEVLSSLDTSENIGIWFDDEMIYSSNSSPYEEAENVDVSTQIISGISGATTNGSVTGFSARAWLSSVLPQKYFYFGGYVGDGNVSVNMYLNYSGELSDAEIEMAVNKDFDIYINGYYSGRYENSSSQFSPAKYNLAAYNSSFKSGENTIKIVGERLFIAGGNIKVTYESSEDYQQETRQDLPGIEGAINLYDGFYVPGNLSELKIFLHFNSEYATFLKIGNVTVFNDSTSGEETRTLDNSYLSSLLDYNQLSQKTIPFRLALEELQETLIGANADVVLITDLSGSMEYRLDSDVNGIARACDDLSLYNSATKRISLAKCLDKMVVDILLNNSGNRLALSAFYGDEDEPYKGRVYEEGLTNDSVYLKGRIEVYNPQGGTCICCSINDAYKILNEQSNSSRKKFVIVMSDGIPTHTCQAASGCAGTRTGLPSNEGLWLGWGAGCYGGLDDCEVNDCKCASQNTNWSSCRLNNDLNATVYSIGFGALSTCTMANKTLGDIANCGKGEYYVSDNATELERFYQEIAEEILELSYSEQTAEITGNISGVLYPDSYIEFNYSKPSVPYGLITTTERRFQDSYYGNFSVFNSSEVLETVVVSYSGPRWTDNVEINNNSFYNLTAYGEAYTKLGDPHSINIPNSFIEEDNLIKLTTGVDAENSTYGSEANKIIYTIKQNISSYTEIVAFAEGCIWTLDFEDGSNQVIHVPDYYYGSKECSYQASGTNISNENDAVQLATYGLLKILDPDLNGKIDVKFTEQNLKISLNEITGIPYIISTEVQARRWS